MFGLYLTNTLQVLVNAYYSGHFSLIDIPKALEANIANHYSHSKGLRPLGKFQNCLMQIHENRGTLFKNANSESQI